MVVAHKALNVLQPTAASLKSVAVVIKHLDLVAASVAVTAAFVVAVTAASVVAVTAASVVIIATLMATTLVVAAMLTPEVTDAATMAVERAFLASVQTTEELDFELVPMLDMFEL